MTDFIRIKTDTDRGDIILNRNNILCIREELHGGVSVTLSSGNTIYIPIHYESIARYIDYDLLVSKDIYSYGSKKESDLMEALDRIHPKI